MSGIMLGNYSISDMERRLGIEFPEELKIFMNASNEHNASNIPAGKWHCFDIPFSLVCGDMDTAKKIHGCLAPLADKMKCQIQIAIKE